jgi:hypothetical protein
MTAMQPITPDPLSPGENGMNRRTFRRAAPIAALLLAACGGSLFDRYDAKAPDVPFIDQYNPAGKGPYYNGSEYCGPAVLAGIAKSRGLSSGLTDADLISVLAAIAGTDPEVGTTGHGMIAGLEAMGMRTDANPGGDLDWIDDQLASGHDVIANGDFYSVPGRENPALHAGHYIAITAARNGWSAYKVTDPADAKVTSMSDTQIETFIRNHPLGGFTISAW